MFSHNNSIFEAYMYETKSLPYGKQRQSGSGFDFIVEGFASVRDDGYILLVPITVFLEAFKYEA